MILLDTSVLIDGDFTFLDPGEVCGASILSRAELEFGVAVASTTQQGAERRRHLALLDNLIDWLPFTEATTRAYGVVSAAIHAQAPARRTDTFIAAQAFQYGIPIATYNVKDFQHIAHLIDIIDPASVKRT